jgi:crotonobetainyl-CoA:carnitine CoA-transferase CaiB-like acyl-CoA transferase
VSSSLFGAALTLKSGAFLSGDRAVPGLVLDANQTGYGAAYRIYRCRDGAWIALAAGSDEAWRRLREVTGVPGLPDSLPPLGDSAAEGRLLEKAFGARDVGTWVSDLRAVGIPVEPVAEPDREGFCAGFTQDPVNRQRGRVVTYDWGERGRVSQPCFPPALGPVPRPAPMGGIPALGEHTSEFLEEI